MSEKGIGQHREICALLARAGYGPIPYWFEMPVSEVYAWVDTINELPKDGGK